MKNTPHQTALKTTFSLNESTFAVRRIPESEPMALLEEVEAYTEYTTNRYFEAIDNSFIVHALKLGVTQGRVLDAGCGPGQLAIKIAPKATDLNITGIDLSDAMVLTAAQQAFKEGLQKRIVFKVGDVKKIPFDDHSFDMVICNSVLHHLNEPVVLFNEINRVVKPEGAILLRDLMRPLFGFYHFHVAWFGRYYHGLLKKLYAASVRAAYTKSELRQILAASDINGAAVFTRGITHMGIERHAWNMDDSSAGSHVGKGK